MLDVNVNGQSLDLGEFSISFELLSPIFNEIGSFSYPFSFPATAKNKSILGFHNRVNNNQATAQKVYCEILLNGLAWKRGNLVITETDKDFYKANFTVGEGYFYQTIKEVKLADLDLGGVRLKADYANAGNWQKIYDKFYPETDFILFPLLMPYFYGDINSNAKSIKLNHDFLNNGFLGYINYYATDYDEAGNTFVLFPFLNLVFRQIFEYLSVNLANNPFYEDESLRQLVLFNHISESYTEEDTSGGGDLPFFNLRDYMPDLTITEFFDFLKSIFRTYFFYNDTTNEVSVKYFKDIINAGVTESFINPYKFNYLKPCEYDGMVVTIGVDSDDSVAQDYFRGISKLKYISDLDSVADLPTYGMSFLDVYYIRDIGQYYYYEIDWTLPGVWTQCPNNIQAFADGNKKLEIEIPGIFYKTDTNRPKCGNNGHWQVKDQLFDVADSPQPRLMFWHGISQANNEIPFGSPFNLFPNGSIAGAYSLEWEGSAGLRENFYKEFIEFQKTTREAEISMILKPAQLKEIDFAKKYRFSEANWLLSSIKFTVTNDKISPATIIAFKA